MITDATATTDSKPDDRDDVLAVHLIVNGELGMSPGKTAAQAFQAAQRLLDAATNGAGTPEQRALVQTWRQEGTCTVVKYAPTRHLFDRARQELDGVTMIDEGWTEVQPNSPTVHASWPLRRQDAPRVWRHKRLRLAPEVAVN